jgi:hypothetical protein
MINLKTLNDKELNELYLELNCEFQFRFNISIHKDKPKFVEIIEELPENYDLVKDFKENNKKIPFFGYF